MKEYLKPHILAWLAPIGIPFIVEGFLLRIFTLSLIAISVAVSLNILYGYTGLGSFGHAAFFGIGAYCSAILVTEQGIPVIISIVLTSVLVGLIGLTISIPVLRTRGLYFSIITLAFNIVTFQIFANWRDVTGGRIGYDSIPTFAYSNKQIFILFYAGVLLQLLFTWKLVGSDIGRVMKSIRDDEKLASEVGINVLQYKILALVVSATLTGTAGAVFAHYNGFLSPNQFTFFESFEYYVMVTIGGSGTLLGPVIGAVLVTVAPEVLRITPEARLLIYGVVLLVVIYSFPNGIIYIIRDIKKYAQRKLNKHSQLLNRQGNQK